MVRFAASWFFAFALLFGTAVISGCDNNEEVMEVETPEGETEVEQDTDTGELEVETD